MLQAQANLMNTASLPTEQSGRIFHLHENTHIYSHVRSSHLWFCWSKTNLFPLALHSSVWSEAYKILFWGKEDVAMGFYADIKNRMWLIVGGNCMEVLAVTA